MSASKGDEDEMREPITDVEATLASGPPDGMSPFVDDLSATDDPLLPRPAAKLEPEPVPAAVAAQLARSTRDRGIFGCESSARFDGLAAEGYDVLGIWTSERPDAPGHAICRRDRELYFVKVAPKDTASIAGRRLYNEMVMTCAFVERARRGHIAHRIAGPVDVGHKDDTAYLVQEHVRGVSWERLVDAAARAPLSVPQLVHLAREAALALDAIHQVIDDDGQPARLVHGDFGARSLVVGEAGEVRVVSWGFARRSGHIWPSEELTLGSLDALSPEHVRSAPLQQSSDLFALGRLIWQLCTGRRLFDARTPREAVVGVLEPLAPPSSLRVRLPGALDALVHKLTALQPEERPSSAREVVAALDALGFGPPDPAELGELIRGADAKTWAILERMRAPAAPNLDEFVVPVPYGRSFMIEVEDRGFGGVMAPPAPSPRVLAQTSTSDHGPPDKPSRLPPPNPSPRRVRKPAWWAVGSLAVLVLSLTWLGWGHQQQRAVGVPFSGLERELLMTATVTPRLASALDRARSVVGRLDASGEPALRGAQPTFPTGAPSSDALRWLLDVRAAEQARRREVLGRLEVLLGAVPSRASHDEPSVQAFSAYLAEQLSSLPLAEADRLRRRLDTLGGQPELARTDAEQASAEFGAIVLGLDP